jgi:EAL domain-containing protein (putative c-di-GMP-specific phosphodiesterase class I)
LLRAAVGTIDAVLPELFGNIQRHIRPQDQRICLLWVDPVRGILSPGEFIPALEKYHLLYKLDLYMAEQVCRDMPRRAERGLPLLPVSVNFSAQDFDYVDIPSELEHIYEKYCLGVEPKVLIIEITEQDLATGTEQFREQLRRLRQKGFHIWLDDFGSGYSSLNVFSRFEVDLIKFDMDFLKNLDGANRRIMKAMTEIARELGIHTLAEGMETEEHREFLKEIGCELAQGYLFHRPEPIESTFYRLDSGQPPRPSETPEERERQIKEWFDVSPGVLKSLLTHVLESRQDPLAYFQR